MHLKSPHSVPVLSHSLPRRLPFQTPYLSLLALGEPSSPCLKTMGTPPWRTLHAPCDISVETCYTDIGFRVGYQQRPGTPMTAPASMSGAPSCSHLLTRLRPLDQEEAQTLSSAAGTRTPPGCPEPHRCRTKIQDVVQQNAPGPVKGGMKAVGRQLSSRVPSWSGRLHRTNGLTVLSLPCCVCNILLPLYTCICTYTFPVHMYM